MISNIMYVMGFLAIFVVIPASCDMAKMSRKRENKNE